MGAPDRGVGRRYDDKTEEKRTEEEPYNEDFITGKGLMSEKNLLVTGNGKTKLV